MIANADVAGGLEVDGAAARAWVERVKGGSGFGRTTNVEDKGNDGSADNDDGASDAGSDADTGYDAGAMVD